MKLKMKLLVILVLSTFTLTTGGAEEKLVNGEDVKFDFSPKTAMSANMNAYTDLVMIQVGPWISSSGLIPMELPDMNQLIEYKPLLITYSGELHLTNGLLTRLVSVARSGNAVMSYNRNMLRIAMTASVRQIAFKYDYKTKIMGLEPSGSMEGSTDQLVMACDFLIDLNDFMIFMQDFRVVTLGSVDITLRGNILVDWLSNLIINTFIYLFRGTVTDYISQQFKEFLQATIDDMNDQRFASSRSVGEIQQMLQNVLKQLGQKPLKSSSVEI